jgi:hypothetical protein
MDAAATADGDPGVRPTISTRRTDPGSSGVLLRDGLFAWAAAEAGAAGEGPTRRLEADPDRRQGREGE